MTDPTKAGRPDPAAESWIYGGLRLHQGKTIHAWLPQQPDGTYPSDAAGELWYPLSGSWVVGSVYQATVTRHDERITLHGKPGPWLHRCEDRAVVARLEVLDRQSRDRLALIALERKAAKDSALANAIQPLLEIAATLVTDAQVRALTAYVTEQIYRARVRRR